MKKVALSGLVLAALALVAVTAAVRGPSPNSGQRQAIERLH